MVTIFEKAEDNLDMLSFTLQSVDIAWEPESRAARFETAVESATNVAPEALERADVRGLLKAGFRDAWGYAEEDGFSVWIHFHAETDDGEKGEVEFEFPFYSRSPIGSFFSPSPSFGVTGDALSGTVLRAIAVLPKDDEDNPDIGGWGGCPEALWEDLTEKEKEFVHAVRGSLLYGNISVFTHLLLKYAEHQRDRSE